MNTRNQLMLLGSIIGISGLALGGVVSVVKSDSSHSTPAVTSILGFSGTIVVSLFTLLKAEQNARLSQENKEALTQNVKELKKNRVETRRNRKRITEAKSQLQSVEQKLNDVEKEISPEAIANLIKIRLQEAGAFPQNEEDLQKIISLVVADACKENKDNNTQLHQIKHAVKNIANIMNLKEEVRRLGGDPDKEE